MQAARVSLRAQHRGNNARRDATWCSRASLTLRAGSFSQKKWHLPVRVDDANQSGGCHSLKNFCSSCGSPRSALFRKAVLLFFQAR